jgi:hypothetical protein
MATGTSPAPARKKGCCGRRIAHHQRALAEVVQQQRRAYQAEPGHRTGQGPKWPMSAYSASPPVSARNTAAWPGRHQRECSDACRAPAGPGGAQRMQHLPGLAQDPEQRRVPQSEPNHSEHHRPEKARPTFAVPWRWIANSPRMHAERHRDRRRARTTGSGNSRPSTARQHRDRRRDQRIAVEERRAEHGERHVTRRVAGLAACRVLRCTSDEQRTGFRPRPDCRRAASAPRTSATR